MNDEELNDQRHEAKLLYWQGWRVSEIAKKIDEKAATVHSWKRRDDWDSTPEVQRVEASISARLSQLVTKPEKSDGELREIEVLTRAMMRTARIRKFDQGGNEGDLNPKVRERAKRGKRGQEAKKNYLDEDQCAALEKAFEESLFGYQRVWQAASALHRIRNILKSRQIGATWYFAREAIVDAIKTGHNKIFLSASKAQAHVFKLYILQFVEEVTGVQLKGDPIVLWNGATLYFLGTNVRTAQSYHGDVYMDEYFWIGKFQEFRKVASGMAMHKQWSLTYFSTPSALSHDAYPFWSGSLHNKGRKKEEHIKLDVSHAMLRDGRLCEDGQWRQMVTVEDAVAGGCDLFDLETLRLEYSEDEYNNLLMCQFIDDSASAFSLSALMQCMVDAMELWTDWKPFSPRPMGSRSVWMGYDPSRTRDDAAIVVLVPPAVPGGKFRIIERIVLQNIGFDKQAEVIRQLKEEKYNVQHIAIDITGIGYGVYDLVKAFFPGVKKISYSPEVKTRLVMKAQSVINNGRLEFDAGNKEIAGAFMSIRKTITPSGNGVTYEAVRSEETGHGDLAWAVMHALDHEPLQGGGGTTQSVMEIF